MSCLVLSCLVLSCLVLSCLEYMLSILNVKLFIIKISILYITCSYLFLSCLNIYGIGILGFRLNHILYFASESPSWISMFLLYQNPVVLTRNFYLNSSASNNKFLIQSRRVIVQIQGVWGRRCGGIVDRKQRSIWAINQAIVLVIYYSLHYYYVQIKKQQ